MIMLKPDVYQITVEKLRNGHNQAIELTLADLLDELEKLNAIPKETIWQMRLAIMHKEQETLA